MYYYYEGMEWNDVDVLIRPSSIKEHHRSSFIAIISVLLQGFDLYHLVKVDAVVASLQKFWTQILIAYLTWLNI